MQRNLLLCIVLFVALVCTLFISPTNASTTNGTATSGEVLLDATSSSTSPLKSGPKQFNITTRRLGDLVEHQPTSISVDAPRGPDVEDQIVIYQREDGTMTMAMTPKQHCDVCHTTIDTGVILLRRGVQINNLPADVREDVIATHDIRYMSSGVYNVTSSRLQWSSADMAEEICERAMLQYKPHYTVGCHELIAEHHETLFSPFGHLDLVEALFNDTEVLQHKLSFCYSAGKCVVGQGLTEEARPTAENTADERTPCGACLELANDSRMIFKRLMTTIPNPESNQKISERCQMSPNNFKGFTETWCASLSARHFKPDSLTKHCSDLMTVHGDDLYDVIKDGNILHRLLKDPSSWETTLCTKVSDMCNPATIKDLYQQWDTAADHDYNVTQARYLLDGALIGHAKLLTDLEEEYFYSPKHMYGPDLSTMSDDELHDYKQHVKAADKLDKLQKRDEDIDLDAGYDATDEAHHESKNNGSEEVSDSVQMIEEEESTTDLSLDMGRHLLGKMSYVDETGVRVPNELPPHIIREYRAKRHDIIHSIKHQRQIQHYQKDLDVLRGNAEQYIGQRRVYSLPDAMHVSKRMTDIMTHFMKRNYEREKGKVAEQLITDTYAKQLSEMKQFSANFQQKNYQQLYDVEDDSSDDNNIKINLGDDEVLNEAATLPNMPPINHRDEL